MMEWRLTGLLLLAWLGTAADAMAAGTVHPALTFAVDYRLGQETADATFALGDKRGEVVPAGRPLRFDLDPLSTQQDGLQVGAGRAGVVYRTAGHLTPGQGTLEMLLKNLDWEWQDGEMHLFLSSYGASPLMLYVYKHGRDGLGVYLRRQSSGESLFLRQLPESWKGGSVHHLTFTWDQAAFALYLDGRRVRTGSFPALAELPERLAVGSPGKMGASGQSAIGLLRLYSQALTPAEVARLAGEQIPELQGQLPAEPPPPQVLPPSPWFQDRPRLGLEALEPEVVPEPWTPVCFAEGRGQVWGREYDFRGRGLVDAVSAGGRKLLRGAVRLEYAAGAVSGEMDLAPARVVQAAPGRVSLVRTGTMARLEGRLEYDGFLWCTLTVPVPPGLHRLQLVVPMSEEAEAVHYVDAVADTRRVRPITYCTRQLDAGPGELFRAEFATHLWLGSTRAGLQFCSESEENCHPYGRDDFFRVVRTASGVDLLITLVDAPLPETAPAELVYRFGLMATPVKPLPAGWRANMLSSQYETLTGEARGSTLVYWPEWAAITLDPEPTRAREPERLRRLIEADRAAGRRIVPYWDRRHLPISQNGVVNPDALAVYEAWSPQPQRPRSGRFDWMRAEGSGFYDYLVWCVDRWNTHLGAMDGVYMDEMILDPNINPAQQAGFTDFAGERRPTYPLLGDRDLYKRIQQVVRVRNGGRPPWSIAHMSGTHMLPLLSHFTVFLTAEHLFSGYFHSQPERLPPDSDRLYYYSYALPMELVKYELFHRQWGAVMAFLPCLKNQREIMELPVPTRDMLSRTLHADVIYWPLWCNREEIYKVERFRRDFDIGAPEVEFTPYWENETVLSDDPEIPVSYYRNGDDYLLIVSNLHRREARVTLRFREFAPVAVRDAVTGEPVAAGDLRLPRNDYVALRLRRPPQ